MTKTLLFILLFPFAAISQARLGSTKSEIYAEFIDLGPRTSLAPDGTEYLVLHTKDYMFLHYFDKADVCITSVIYPENLDAENALVERYNSNYVCIEPGKWRMYTSNERYDVVKRVTVNQLTYFIWD
jgi:hypothetical protein